PRESRVTRGRRLVRGAVVALAIVSTGGLAGAVLATLVMTRQGSPERLRSRAGSLVRVQTRPLPRAGPSRFDTLELRSSTGLDVHGLVRVPDACRPPYAGAVVVGGIKRGSRIVTVSGLDAIARSAVHVPHWAAPVVGRALAWWLTPLTPERFAPAIAPRTLIMVNGAGDSLVPRRYVMALYDAAREPKELVWVEGEHLQPSETALLERLSGVVTARLVAHGLLR